MTTVYSQTLIRLLNEINFQDLVSALGWEHRRFLTKLARTFLYAYPRRFTKAALRFDDDVERRGLGPAAAEFAAFFTRNVEVRGIDHIPQNGPVLFVSNHPGLYDTLLLFGAIPRKDLRIIAAERPFLQALPNVSRSLIFVPETGGFSTLRPALEHLKSGRALLTFPAGRIEPDPAIYPEEAARLQHWSQSTDFFLRLVPSATVVPVRVSGVLAPGAQFNPLTKLRKKREDRERMGAMLQLVARFLSPGLWGIHPRVEFFRPLAAEDLRTHRQSGGLLKALIDLYAG